MKDVLRTFASRITSLLQSGISSPVGRICLAGLGIALLLVFYTTCTTIVNQGEISVVMQFGKPVRVIIEPGALFQAAASVPSTSQTRRSSAHA